MADVSGKFFSAKKVRTGVSPSSPGVEQGETLPPVNPPGTSLNSVGLTMPSAFAVANSPLTSNGTIAVTGAGTVAQYVRGDGSLADFPESSGGGSSVSYYLNGSVSQGTIGGVAYLEMNKVPILGAGTDFTRNSNGYIASFITDAGDPNLLEIPGGNWNFESYFSASSGGGSPTFYVELYKVNAGGTATLIASNSANPELISFGTTIAPYFSSLAVPTTVLALTDRLAVRYYVTPSGRTLKLHTEGPHLCQIITTFTTGITALNGLTAQVQNFAVGTSGTNFNIASATDTHTFNLPTASATNRGALASADWSTFNNKQNQLNGTGFVKASGTTITYDNSTYQVTSEKAQPNGYASLDGNGKVPLAQINDALIGNVNYQGLWNASTNNPTLVNPPSSGTKGYYYIVSTAGTFAGISFEVGDWIISNGSAWQKVDNTDAVSSVFGRTGNVIAANGDYNTSLVTENTNLYFTQARVSANTDVAANTAARHNAVTLGTANGLSLSTQQLSLQLATSGQNGALSSTDWTTFNNKENAITAGTTAQYFRGDKTFQTLNTSVVPESGNLYFTNARAIASVLTGYTSGAGTISAADSILSAIQKLNGNISALVTGVSSVNGQTGAVTLTTTNIAEGTNLYYTEARVNANTNVAANTAARHAAVTLGTANGLSLSTQQLSLGLASAGVTGALSGTDWSTFNSKQQALNGTGFVKISGTTISYDNSTYLTTAAAASTYLPLAGGTMTGVITTPNGTFGIIVGDDSRLADRNIANTLFLEGVQNNDRGYINFSETTGNALGAVNGGNLTWRGNVVWHAGNITPVPTSRTITINGTTQDLSDNRIYNVGTVTSVTASSPLFSSGGATPNITIQQASGSQNGFLSSTDWTTFNNKQAALNGTGFVKISGTTISYDNSTYYLASNPSAFIALTALSGTAPIQYNNTTGAISITQASGSTNGFLSSTDWNTFNNKTSNVGTVTSVAALTLGTSGTDLSSTVANGTTTPVITLNVPTASASNRGALSAADWTTFNNKQNALTNPVTGTGTAGQVAYWSSGSAITGESNLFWDATNDRLGIGVNNPAYKLEVNGKIFSSTELQANNAVINTTGGYATFGSNSSAVGVRVGRDAFFDDIIINTGGNVSIGTTSDPGFKLNVNGTGRFSGALTTSGDLFISGASKAVVFNSAANFFTQIYELSGSLVLQTGNNPRLTLASTGAATFSSSVTAGSIIRSGGTSSQYLMADGSVSTLTNPVTGTGSGTTNTIPKFTGANALGNSIITDSGSLVSIDGNFRIRNSNGFNDSVNFDRTAINGLILNSSGNLILNGSTGSSRITCYGDGYFSGGVQTGLTTGASSSSIWLLGQARGGTVTTNATVRVEIGGVLVDLVARYV